MKWPSRISALALIVFLACLPLLADTKIVHRWVLTGLPMPEIHKMLVAGIMDNYLIRQEFEDEMQTQLAKYGVEGVQSYMFLPPVNEMMEGEMKQRIKESSLDSVMVIRPKEVRMESQEVTTGRMYVPPPGYYTFWPYWNLVSPDLFPSSPVTKQNIVVRVEFNLYNTQNEKLLWSGESDTVYSTDFEKFGKRYARMLVNQLKKDKVIHKK